MSYLYLYAFRVQQFVDGIRKNRKLFSNSESYFFFLSIFFNIHRSRRGRRGEVATAMKVKCFFTSKSNCAQFFFSFIHVFCLFIFLSVLYCETVIIQIIFCHDNKNNKKNILFCNTFSRMFFVTPRRCKQFFVYAYLLSTVIIYQI